jgi:uncharacterized cupredoxin-like copper-binding protein
MLIAGLGLAGCSSSSNSSSTASTAANGGANVATSAPASSSPSGTAEPTGTTATGPSGSTVAGAQVNITVGDTSGLNGPMTLVATPASVKAGDVTFNVKNTGTIEHEVIVLKTDTAYDKLPVVDSGDPPVSVATGADKVDESSSVGETGDPNIQPGETRSFTVKDMTAGKYVLVCNIAQHYAMGMRAPFTVT